MGKRDKRIEGLEWAIALVETYEAGVATSNRSHADVRAQTAAEIAKCLRNVLDATKLL